MTPTVSALSTPLGASLDNVGVLMSRTFSQGQLGAVLTAHAQSHSLAWHSGFS